MFIGDNEKSVRTLTNVLKDEYIVRANMLADVLDEKVGLQGEAEDYQELAKRMCQDMVPNTAEGKMMMYAMVWNST